MATVMDDNPVNPTFDAGYFARMFDRFPDPWGLSGNAYEHRKRALLMASLPNARFPRAFEPGCANGDLTALLATRCDALIAADIVPRAVDTTRERMRDAPHVAVRAMTIPDEWPDGRFDLIVLSEMAYYLDAAALDEVARKVRLSLTATGMLLGCHWKPHTQGCHFDGESAHARLAQQTALQRIVHHDEADFVLDIWSPDTRSVAQREGIR